MCIMKTAHVHWQTVWLPSDRYACQCRVTLCPWRLVYETALVADRRWTKHVFYKHPCYRITSRFGPGLKLLTGGLFRGFGQNNAVRLAKFWPRGAVFRGGLNIEVIRHMIVYLISSIVIRRNGSTSIIRCSKSFTSLLKYEGVANWPALILLYSPDDGSPSNAILDVSIAYRTMPHDHTSTSGPAYCLQQFCTAWILNYNFWNKNLNFISYLVKVISQFHLLDHGKWLRMQIYTEINIVHRIFSNLFIYFIFIRCSHFVCIFLPKS